MPTNSSRASALKCATSGPKSRLRTAALNRSTWSVTSRVPVVVSIATATSPRLAGGLHGLVIGIGAGGRLGDEQRFVGHVDLEARLAEDRAVALVLEPQGKILAAALHDPALGQDMDDIRGDVVEQALVMGDQEHAELGVEHRIDALGDDPQGVDVEPGVGLIEDRDLGLDDRHLEHLQPLLLAAAEALVDV